MTAQPVSGPPAIAAEQVEAASRFCRDCGLCCDGTMFGFVPLRSEEATRLRDRLPVLPASANLETRFEQRCVALGPHGCAIYADRPNSCSQFRCKLLRRLEAGAISLDVAREVVARVRGHANALDRRLPPGNSLHARRQLLPMLATRPGDPPSPELGELWLDVKVLEVLLRRELRYDDPEEAPTADPPPRT